MKRLLLLILCAFPVFAQEVIRPVRPGWRQKLEAQLPYLGHRNWIVIADSAYPLQSNPGIETILSSDNHIQTVRAVLNILDHVKHVRPVIYTDKELSFVPEADAPGIDAFRQLLTGIFQTRTVQTIPHEDIIRKLDEAGQAFKVLIIKTNLTIPYTSVFLELRAQYWGDDAEQRLRRNMH